MPNSTQTGQLPLILICREHYEGALLEEAGVKLGVHDGSRRARFIQQPDLGWVKIEGDLLFPANPAPPSFVFERQRLIGAVWMEDRSLKLMAREIAIRILPAISRTQTPWTLHAFAADPDSNRPLTRRARNLRDVFLDFCARRFTAVSKRYRPAAKTDAAPDLLVLQLCLIPGGLWSAVMPFSQLTDSHPGGIHRMPFDPRAPSRSYLKIEEVFDRMGEAPRPRQRVVDLGAAPGGWSHAFLKRGCHVLAVDHGPMKITAQGSAGGRLEHVRENGITFRPPRNWQPVDWMVSDMLIPPGQALGMIRKWLEESLARRIVFNIKLPQQHPYPVLQPIEPCLRKPPGLRFQMRQLYHDRREVTVFGVCE